MTKKDAKKTADQTRNNSATKESKNTDEQVPERKSQIPSKKKSQEAQGSPGFCRRLIPILKYTILVLMIPPFLNYAALQQEAKVLLTEGLMYDIGFGQKLYFKCMGTGRPTVIMDGPTGMSSDVWSLIQPELARLTKVCIYDRAGLGFSERPFKNISEPASNKENRNRWSEFTVERMVDDLHKLVTYSSQQERPFIFVGSELGALISRFYTHIFEGDVSDMVLIDPLVENIFTQDNSIWSQYWFDHLIPSFQSMQVAAATGLTRLALILNLINHPMSGDGITDEVNMRQKNCLCNPRHMSSIVDEHHFINESFSQMNTINMMKQFPQNVTVTVITGNYYDEQLPSALNKAWAKSQQHLISVLHPSSNHIVVNGADHHMLYRKPEADIEPIKRLVRQRRSKLPVVMETKGS